MGGFISAVTSIFSPPDPKPKSKPKSKPKPKPKPEPEEAERQNAPSVRDRSAARITALGNRALEEEEESGRTRKTILGR